MAATLVLAACGSGAPAADRVALERAGRGYLDVVLPTFDDVRSFALADLAGRPAVVNFFASWCAPCVSEMPAFEEVKAAVGAEVAFVGVDVQDRIEDGEALVERTGITWEVARDPDGELVRAVGGVGMPTTVLLDAAGAIVELRTGALNRDQLGDLVAEHFGVEVDA